MAYTYKGTRITGTSTTAKIFKNSGVKKAKVGDTYFNTETGHVYKCTTAGAPEKAKWEYKRTDIADKPSLTVKGFKQKPCFPVYNQLFMASIIRCNNRLFTHHTFHDV